MHMISLDGGCHYDFVQDQVVHDRNRSRCIHPKFIDQQQLAAEIREMYSEQIEEAKKIRKATQESKQLAAIQTLITESIKAGKQCVDLGDTARQYFEFLDLSPEDRQKYNICIAVRREDEGGERMYLVKRPGDEFRKYAMMKYC